MIITRANATRRRGTRDVPSARGFTLLELTAVVAIITVLVSLLCAALNQTKMKAFRISCLDNLKQLQLAWDFYIDDNDGSLPLNQTAESTVGKARRTSADSWVTGNPREDRTSENLEQGTLFRYVKSPEAYRCPMDDSSVDGHPEIRRTRSYAMNSYLGGDEVLNPALKYSELHRPDNTFVFIEEHQNSQWESSFVVVVPSQRPGSFKAAATPQTSWISTPADRHEQGCNLSFADGHIEYWRWYSPKSPKDGKLSTASARNRDVRDLQRLQMVVGQ